MTLSDIGKEDEGEQVWHCKPKSWFSLSTHKHGTEFLKKNQLYFLWPKMMFRWGWKAKTHRLKPCFPKFPCACRQTLSKKNIQPSLMTDWKSEIWHGHKSPVTVNTTWKQMSVGSMFTSRNKNSFEMPQTGVFIRTMMISLFFK